MNPILINFLTSIVSITFGFGLKSYSQHRDNKKAQKEMLNTTMFNLLELRYQLKRITGFEEMMEALINRASLQFSKDLPELPSLKESQEINQVIEYVKSSFLTTNKLKEIESEMKNSINEISKNDAFLAYDLIEITEISTKLQQIELYLNQARQLTSIDEINKLRVFFKDILSEQTYQKIEDNIKRTAKQISVNALRQANEIIISQDKVNPISMDNYINRVANHLKKAS